MQAESMKHEQIYIDPEVLMTRRLLQQLTMLLVVCIVAVPGIVTAQTYDEIHLINNNLGYCLNCLGECTRAEEYCRTAIRIDPGRHNAYKNLGVSLQGQRRIVEAAKAFIASVWRCPKDPRALSHLAALTEAHPEISEGFPDIHSQLQACVEVTRDAASRRQQARRVNGGEGSQGSCA